MTIGGCYYKVYGVKKHFRTWRRAVAAARSIAERDYEGADVTRVCPGGKSRLVADCFNPGRRKVDVKCIMKPRRTKR